MAYGSTVGMTTNASTHFGTPLPPRVQKVDGAGLCAGHSVLTYRSSHSHGDIEAAGFFTDGLRDGMKRGDLLINICDSTAGSSAATMHVVSDSTGAVGASTQASSCYEQAYNVSVSLATT